MNVSSLLSSLHSSSPTTARTSRASQSSGDLEADHGGVGPGASSPTNGCQTMNVSSWPCRSPRWSRQRSAAGRQFMSMSSIIEVPTGLCGSPPISRPRADVADRRRGSGQAARDIAARAGDLHHRPVLPRVRRRCALPGPRRRGHHLEFRVPARRAARDGERRRSIRAGPWITRRARRRAASASAACWRSRTAAAGRTGRPDRRRGRRARRRGRPSGRPRVRRRRG